MVITFITITPVYSSRKLVDSFSQTHFFGELGTNFSDCARGSKLRNLCSKMSVAFFQNSISLSRYLNNTDVIKH